MYEGVCEQTEKENNSGNYQTHEDTEQKNTHLVWSDWTVATGSTVNYTGIIVGHSLGKRILLTTVQQEEVQRLLDFLLTLDGQHLAFLGWNGRHPYLCISSTTDSIVTTYTETYYHIVYGTDNALLHSMQRTVQFLHNGVAVAAVFYQFVATQLDSVVLADLCLHTGIAYTGI